MKDSLDDIANSKSGAEAAIKIMVFGMFYLPLVIVIGILKGIFGIFFPAKKKTKKGKQNSSSLSLSNSSASINKAVSKTEKKSKSTEKNSSETPPKLYSGAI